MDNLSHVVETTKEKENICQLRAINVSWIFYRNIFVLNQWGSLYFQAIYEPTHGFLAIPLCILGTLFNMINIIVLTHKDMRSNPINLILTGIAIADMMVMVEYIPFAIHMYLLDESYRSLEDQVILKS